MSARTEDHKSPRVLVIGKDQELSDKDRSALEAVGFTVVRVRYPSQVRFLDGESPAMNANDMLRAAISGLASLGESTYGREAKMRAWDALVKIISERPKS